MDNLLAGDVAVITAPTEEPITTAEAKLHLRVDHAADDALIASMITAARQRVENATWRALVTQTLELTLDAWPSGNKIDLPRPPLASVTSVTYTDSDGTATVWSSSLYQVITQGTPGRIVPAYGEAWPTATLRAANGIAVRYVAGYGAAAAVPALLKAAMLLLIGNWYENREAVVVGAGLAATPLPMAVESILSDYMVR
jgi:uncharacterized phiE125 gp8 family phage protein